MCPRRPSPSPSAVLGIEARDGAAGQTDLTQGQHVTNDEPGPAGTHADAARADVLVRAAVTRSNFTAFIAAARALLAEQPSQRSLHAQARRLSTVVHEIADDLAGGGR